METLYRIISFPAFVHLVESSSEWLVRPTSWADTYEGYMLRLLENPQKRGDVLKALYQEVFSNDIETTIFNYDQCEEAEKMLAEIKQYYQ